MLNKEVTPEMIKEWKEVYEKNRHSLKPNRKTGMELNEYLQAKYPVTPIHSEKANQVVVENVMNNQCFKEKLPQGIEPKPVTYYVGTDKIFVGIDLLSGFFCVEGSEEIHDDLFAFRGLDETDLENYFLVAEYIRCKKR